MAGYPGDKLAGDVASAPAKPAGSFFRRLFGSPTQQAAPAAEPSLRHIAPARPTPAPVAPPSPGVDFHRLRSNRGNWLCIDPALPGEPPKLGMSNTLDAANAVLACRPRGHKQLCFLMSPDGQPFAVRGDGMTSIAVSALLVQTDVQGIARVKHPLANNRFLGVTQPGQGGADGWVIFDSVGHTMFDAFGFIATPAQGVPAGLRIVADEIAAVAVQPFTAEPLLRALRSGVVRLELAETLIRLLPVDELAVLARVLLENPADMELLGRATPGNPWMRTALPALANWRARRTPAGIAGVVTSPASDEFAGLAFEGFGQPQAGLALQSMARRQISPRRSACVLSTARNEGPYLLDWISYHLSIGFDHIFLYTNDNTDGSDPLLDALAAHGAITLIRNEAATRVSPQYKAYSHALLLLPQILDYRWTAVLDMDEYLGFDATMFGRVVDYIAWQETQPVDAIALCWLVFAAGRKDVWSEQSSLQRFTRRDNGVNPHVKSLFRTNMFWHSHAHYPNPAMGAPFVFRTSSGVLHHHHGVAERIPAFAEHPNADHAWVNHYHLRTAQEALWKMARGRGDLTVARAEQERDYHRHICATFLNLSRPEVTVEDRRIQACAAGQANILQSLLALPGVAASNQAVQQGFATRLRQTTRAFLETPAVAGEPEAIGRFRAMLADLPATL